MFINVLHELLSFLTQAQCGSLFVYKKNDTMYIYRFDKYVTLHSPTIFEIYV